MNTEPYDVDQALAECRCGSPTTTSLNPDEVVVHGPDACRIAQRADK